MSDDQRTPRGTARINSERFDTELAAVWFAANFYYEASFQRQREYAGVVFRDGEKFGITVRNDSTSSHAFASPDVPAGTIPVAIWHTHLPASMSGEHPAANAIFGEFFRVLVGERLEHQFSDDDRNTSVSWSKKFGRTIPIYLVTAKVIKRFRERNQEEEIWAKDPPSRMQDRKDLP